MILGIKIRVDELTPVLWIRLNNHIKNKYMIQQNMNPGVWNVALITSLEAQKTYLFSTCYKLPRANKWHIMFTTPPNECTPTNPIVYTYTSYISIL